jgi:hypothetical protein
MKPRQPAAARPLLLLTLAVLAAHLLLLREPLVRAPPPLPSIGHLVTRVLEIGAASPQIAPEPTKIQFSEEKTAVARTGRRSPAIESVAKPIPQAAPPQLPAASEQAVAPLPPASAPAVTAPQSAAPAMAFAIPGSVHLRYGVSGQSRGQSWNFSGELVWRHDGSNYEAKLEYSSPLLPSRTQQSTGRITAQGLAPLRFSDKGRSEQATHFERESGTLVFSSNAPRVPLLPGAQDRLSVFMQLAAMLAADPAKFPAGSTIAMQTAGTRDAEPWVFTVEGDEVLELPGGSVPSRKLLRLPRREYDIRVELWLAPGMDYVPVRIRLTQPNGDFVDQQWASTDRSAPR